jgi:predicted metal-dependent HD superfamily phosphohydrolase
MLLKARFFRLLENLGVDKSQIDDQWEELWEKYREPFRTYHNQNHLNELFKYFDTYNDNLEHPSEVAYAIFYHDIIYKVWSKNNELNSAELATEYLLVTNRSEREVKRVFDLIMSTNDHTPRKNTDEKWMIDFDLAILGQSWDIYHDYTHKIREEYSTVPGFMYRKGRRKVLNHFLNKKRIFKTDTFYNLYEMKARENMKKELEIL